MRLHLCIDTGIDRPSSTSEVIVHRRTQIGRIGIGAEYAMPIGGKIIGGIVARTNGGFGRDCIRKRGA